MVVRAKVCDLTEDLLWFVCGLYVGILTSSLILWVLLMVRKEGGSGILTFDWWREDGQDYREDGVALGPSIYKRRGVGFGTFYAGEEGADQEFRREDWVLSAMTKTSLIWAMLDVKSGLTTGGQLSDTYFLTGIDSQYVHQGEMGQAGRGGDQDGRRDLTLSPRPVYTDHVPVPPWPYGLHGIKGLWPK